jgi:outer membrane protein assembly factor BamB
MGETVYVAMFGKDALHVLEAEKGKRVWKFDIGNRYHVNATDPIILDDRIFVTQLFESAMLEKAMKKPKVIWRKEELKAEFNNVVIHQNMMYLNTGNMLYNEGEYLCAEFRSGKIQWIKDFGVGSLILIKDKLIMLSNRGVIRVVAASPKEYRQLAQCALQRDLYCTPPAYWDGKLYIRNNNKGNLFCLNVISKRGRGEMP